MKLTDPQMEAMLLALTDTGGPFDPVATFVGVGTAVADHGGETVRADITAAPGTAGVATAVATWGLPHKLADGRWAIDAPLKNFKIASSADACQITVWYLASLATLGVLLGWGAIFPAANMVDEFSLYSLLVRLTIDGQGRWSAEVGING